MIFCGITKAEQIYLQADDDLDKIYVIELLRDGYEPKFTAWSDYDKDWTWDFWYTSETDYERVKWAILDMIDEYNSIPAVLIALNDAFLEYFVDMLVDNKKECECYSNNLN